MGTLIHDIRYTFRRLAREPGLAAVVVLSLALAIGAGTAIYSLADAVLLRPLPVEAPERLVAVFTSRSDGSRYANPGYPDYRDYAARTDIFGGLAAYGELALSLSGQAGNARVRGGLVTGDYFPILGVRAAVGRALVPEDDRAGAGVVVLAHRFWRSRYGADPGVVGRTIRLNDHPFTVVGVAPDGFNGVRLDRAPDLWVPMQEYPRLATGFLARIDVFNERGVRWLNTVGRLRAGVTIAEAKAELEVVAEALAEAYPDTNEGRSVTVVPATMGAALRDRGELLRFMGMLAAVIGLAVLIACGNVANLLLGRALARQREIGVRRALGAGRRRLVRQFLTESVTLSLLAGGLGVGLAVVGLRLLHAYELPGSIPIAVLDPGLDGRVLLVTSALALGTGLGFGMVPALQASKPDLVRAFKDGGRASAGRTGLRGFLVALQVALCALLLVGAGLFLRSLSSALALDPGFDVDRVLAASLDLGPEGYDEPRARVFFERLLEDARTLPGVSAAALARSVPISPGGSRRTVNVPGYEPGPDEDMELDYNVVTPGYLRTMGIPVLAGRGFRASDDERAPAVMLVNRAAADRYWPDASPLGRRVGLSGTGGPWARVVGVVGDGLYRDLGEPDRPYLYLPLAQAFDLAGLRTVNLVLRSDGQPAALGPGLRRLVRSLDPDLPVFRVRTLEEQLAGLLLPQRMGSALLGLLGSLALVLAAVGIYGVVAYAVTRRRREIGIRSALGASPVRVVRIVMQSTLGAAVAGLAAGLVAAYSGGRLIAAFLHDVRPDDPLTFVAVAVGTLLIALLASYIPARRAARVDPAETLRHE